MEPLGHATVPARELAESLAAAADQLARAADLGGFMEAVEAHRRVWQGIMWAAPRLGHLVSEQLMEYSLSAAERARHRLTDQEVETLIHIDRFVSATIAKSCAV